VLPRGRPGAQALVFLRRRLRRAGRRNLRRGWRRAGGTLPDLVLSLAPDFGPGGGAGDDRAGHLRGAGDLRLARAGARPGGHSPGRRQPAVRTLRGAPGLRAARSTPETDLCLHAVGHHGPAADAGMRQDTGQSPADCPVPAESEPHAGGEVERWCNWDCPVPAESEPHAGGEVERWCNWDCPVPAESEPHAGGEVEGWCNWDCPVPAESEPHAGGEVEGWCNWDCPVPAESEPHAGGEVERWCNWDCPVPAESEPHAGGEVRGGCRPGDMSDEL